MDLNEFLKKELADIKAKSLYRSLNCIGSVQGPVVRFADGKDRALFCSNNYLDLAGDERIVRAVVDAVGQWGWGTAASRLISGTMGPHAELERRFARFFRKEAALYFSSGWCANEAILTTLPQKGDLVLIDRMSHASIIDAVGKGAAAFHTYRRENLGRAEKFLADGAYRRKFIVTESVFSMDGDRADLAALVELKERCGAALVVDEAHSAGCMGPTGAGLTEQEGLLDKIDIIVAPLGKAFATGGAVIAASKTVIDYLVNTARPFIYTTAPSPAAAAAAIAALDIVQEEPWRREKLGENAKYLLNKLKGMGLDTGGSDTHIIPVILGSAEKSLKIAEALFKKGYYVSAIRPPTVPRESARLRVSVQCGHTKEQLDGLCRALGEILPLPK